MALHKIETLLQYGPRICACAKDFLPEIEAMQEISLTYGPFDESMLEGKCCVIAATDDAACNHQISLACRNRNLPVNVVDDQEYCSFIFPAVIKRGRLSLGISTGGASPTAAVHLKEQIDALLPDRFEEILDYLEGCRETIRREVPGEADRARIYASLFRSCLAQNGPCTDHQLRAILEEVRHVP